MVAGKGTAVFTTRRMWSWRRASANSPAERIAGGLDARSGWSPSRSYLGHRTRALDLPGMFRYEGTGVQDFNRPMEERP
jgi:hypothetical protein